MTLLTPSIFLNDSKNGADDHTYLRSPSTFGCGDFADDSGSGLLLAIEREMQAPRLDMLYA